jgi:hypothetical protein
VLRARCRENDCARFPTQYAIRDWHAVAKRDWPITAGDSGAGARSVFLQRIHKGNAALAFKATAVVQGLTGREICREKAKKLHTWRPDESGAGQRPKIRVTVSMSRFPQRQ